MTEELQGVEIDASEFGQLIKLVANNKIPAYVDDPHVYLTNGVPIKKGGAIIREVSSIAPIILPGRNDPCFCGSERKYKKCCMDIVEQEKGVS
jgi:uncharacterized protein YecA (UPF0149 family)